jgi:hypothetical protein
LALWATGKILTGQPQNHLLSCLRYLFRQLNSWINEFSNKRDALIFVGVCQEAKISDFHEPVWQDMQKEAPDKLIGSKSYYLFFIVCLAITVSEDDFPIINFDDAIV